ncbi:MAG: hypothetical protein QOJ03_126 [Frankiaceae bacterium]|nr:hypothetical protein [Frankiaceae bacterium]
MTRPRFLLVPGHSVAGRPVPPWPGSGRDADSVPSSGTWVAWRLLGSNHREVARSAGGFSDITACLAAIRELRIALVNGTASIGVETTQGLWGWVLSVGERPRAVASRLYQRHRECDYSCRVFLAAAPAAELTPPPRSLRARPP